ncbi:DUF2281 domain-containing protein [Microcystis aeruginosa]|uniref:DUF2281 domain-containing protein n=1 Tax=Microcystis aeruginosa TaxID=1126 RepID=UPI001F278220|nr:DUF2281 domain-containing protein [Microcystis aeruginosa]MDB9397353.1 DUF2281 domain-containing protein [Microcystis aeruginosa CS-573]
MSIDSALKNIVENMPDALKTELLHYAEYLLTKSDQTEENKALRDLVWFDMGA